MTKSDVIAKLEEISSKSGFIYTLSSLLFKHLFLEPKDNNLKRDERISFQEFTLLIGLMVKHEINLDIPTEQQSVNDTEEILKLIQELHKIHLIPFYDKIKLDYSVGRIEKMTNDEKDNKSREFFGSGEMMLEPIFYGGSGAYDFQYTEMAIQKYIYDDTWLEKEKGFSIRHSNKIVDNLKKITIQKLEKLNEANSFEDFCKLILNAFSFSNEDITIVDEIISKAFVKAFCLNPGTVNKTFNQIGQYNKFASHPIIKLSENNYFLPIFFTLTESIYESPFYWMFNTEYKDMASRNRGQATEDIAFALLFPVFGDGLHRNIRIKKGKAQNKTDIDILAVKGNKAIVFQAKSKRLTELARQGDTEKLKKDFKNAIQDAYVQGLICRDAILNKSNKLFDKEGNEIKLDESIDEIYIVCLTADNYPALLNQVDTYLERKHEDPFPIAMSVFDLDFVTFYLSNPIEFLYYIRQRTVFSGYFKASSETAFLGFHLNQKLWPNPDNNMALIDLSCAQDVETNFIAIRGIKDDNSEVQKMDLKWKIIQLEELIKEIINVEENYCIDAIFHLYDLSDGDVDVLVKNIERTINATKRDGKYHDFALVKQDGASGITFFSQYGSPETLKSNLIKLATLQKYKRKADRWLALGNVPNNDKVIEVFGYINQPWVFDEMLEGLSKIMLKHVNAYDVNRKKLGRNDPCPCGKLKPDNTPIKFKNCCGK
ncbi:MAG TPA: hypothetical protein PLS73_00605 [Saprospiraceae bacterium]|nr:hypothetical protein [Saprospiraceae bacterium]